MKKSSINFKPVTSYSEQHNQRQIIPDYVIASDENIPDNLYVVQESIAERLEKIKSLYNSKVGQKWQNQMTPIKEAVVVLDRPSFYDGDEYYLTTVQEKIEILNECLNKKYGISCFQYYIHLDEGKEERGKITPVFDRNLHAHLIFDWQNKATGRMAKLGRADMRDIQTITAECLGLERGKFFSKAERLEHKEYRQIMKELNADIEQKQTKLEELKEEILLKKQKRTRLIESARKLNIELTLLSIK